VHRPSEIGNGKSQKSSCVYRCGCFECLRSLVKFPQPDGSGWSKLPKTFHGNYELCCPLWLIIRLMIDQHSTWTMNPWRRWISWVGYVGVFLLFAPHGAFWQRAGALGGCWGHLNEAGLWFQAIDLTSVLVILCCSFGGGWRRWAGTARGAVSFALTCMYGMGL
jgi:hypothetical protein